MVLTLYELTQGDLTLGTGEFSFSFGGGLVGEEVGGRGRNEATGLLYFLVLTTREE